MKQETKKKLPLKAWLSLSFIIFTIFLLGALWLLQTVFLDSTYKFIKTNQVKLCAQSISDNIENEGISDLIYEIKEQNDMAVSIYDVSSNLFECVSSNDPSSTGIRSFLNMSDIYKYYNKAVENGGDIFITEKEGYKGKIKSKYSFKMDRSNNFGDDSSVPDDIPDAPWNKETESSDTQNETKESAPKTESTPSTGKISYFSLLSSDKSDINEDIRNDDPPFERESIESIAYGLISKQSDSTYFIIVESEITPVTSVVQTLRIELIIVTVIMILISIIIAVITAARIARPISKTNETAKELAKQNYDLHFDKSNYREIAELNQTLNYAAKELGNVDALRKELIANVSHDLRTPLTMITGYAQVMQDIPGENTPENLQIIIDESNRLSMLVNDLLDISKLEAGAIMMEKNLFCITNCIEDIFNRYTKLREQEGYKLEFIKENDVYVVADELKITQVIYNLINNAINYVGEDKTVIVKQTVVNQKVRIDIIDHGEGISEDYLPYIWDRYYKVDKEHKRAVVGTGLGLSIVKNILNEHNAEYGVESKKGKGSDFYFILPTADISE